MNNNLAMFEERAANNAAMLRDTVFISMAIGVLIGWLWALFGKAVILWPLILYQWCREQWVSSCGGPSPQVELISVAKREEETYFPPLEVLTNCCCKSPEIEHMTVPQPAPAVTYPLFCNAPSSSSSSVGPRGANCGGRTRSHTSLPSTDSESTEGRAMLFGNPIQGGAPAAIFPSENNKKETPWWAVIGNGIKAKARELMGGRKGHGGGEVEIAPVHPAPCLV